MQTETLDIYQGQYQGIKKELEEILDFCPELAKLPNELNRLKGVLQFSKIEAYGFSYWEENWHRVDLVIRYYKGFKMSQLDLNLAIDKYEMTLNNAPESTIWVFTEHQTPMDGKKRGLCFFTVYK